MSIDFKVGDIVFERGCERLFGCTNDRLCRAIRAKARCRVYRFLAEKLGIDSKDCHTGMFDLDRCRAAWRTLNGVAYPQIRDWDKAKKVTE